MKLELSELEYSWVIGALLDARPLPEHPECETCSLWVDRYRGLGRVLVAQYGEPMDEGDMEGDG